MAEKFRFELVSPERLVLSEEVEQVVVPGSEGQFTVLPNHAPVLTTLRPGLLDITIGGADTRHIYVRGGFAGVDPQNLTVLAQQAVDLDNLDREKLDQEIRDMEEDVADAGDDDTRQRAQYALDHLKDLQASLNG